MLVSYNKDLKEFMKDFMVHGRQLRHSSDFLGNCSTAMKNGKHVEFANYFIDNRDNIKQGLLQDIYISPYISNIETFFMVFEYLDSDSNTQFFVTPPMFDDTIEYNDINMDKYYLHSHLDNIGDELYRVTILEN